MITLGLARVQALLRAVGDPQKQLKVIHVAGTNGKGSVCTYLESMLAHSRKTTGKFTSPHLRWPRDAIQINRKPLPAVEYEQLTHNFADMSCKYSIGASEFEIQTSAAFAAFAKHNVDISVVEVGLGGLEDATNVLNPENVLCTVITKVGIDHEAFLGTDLESIARQKAGIIKSGVPCIIDGSNNARVIDIVRQTCRDNSAPLTIVPPKSFYKEQNQAVAAACLQQAFCLDESVITKGINDVVWPGRLQWLEPSVLLDGAHNENAALELRSYIDTLQRPVRWVLAFSKPAKPLIDILVKPGDEVFGTEFGPVEGMPWVHAQPASTISDKIVKISEIDDLPRDKLTIIGGSLYLVGEYLRTRESSI